MQPIPGADLALIETWIAKGQFERALKPLESLALSDPTSARVWKNLGVVQQQLGKHTQAEKLLLHAIELDGGDIDAHCSLGGVYRSQGDLAQAAAQFEQGLALSNNQSTFALLNYLATCARAGTLDSALARYGDALDAGAARCAEDFEAGRNLPWACFDLAQCHFLRGDLADCRDAVTEAVRLANAGWQLDSATASYRLMAESPVERTRADAIDVLALIDALKNEYFAEPNRKRCFVIMPFGTKLDAADEQVDFDAVYENFIKPTIESEGLECIRCDEVDEAGNIHKRMFQMIWRADVAIADVSLPNPNVFYELGIRHTLHRAVTIIIRNRNATLPFNIANLNAIEYDCSRGAIDPEARGRIRRAISAGLGEDASDSHVYETLGLRISDPPRVIGRCDVYGYPIRNSGRRLALITGDLRNVRGIEVWVNSENTNMQMARFFDFAISSMIRFEGARKSRTGHVAEDLIQNQLDEIMCGERSVPEAAVIATGPGELQSKYGVQAIFHAASVRGTIGEGYEPVRDIQRCITNALALMDDPTANVAGRGLSSILFPLMGIGFARGDFRPLLHRQVEAALEYLAGHPDSAIETIYFLAWSEQELALCQSVLRSFDVLGAPVRSRQPPPPMPSQPATAKILVLMPMLPGYEAVREAVAATIDRAGLGMLRLETLLEDWEWLDWLDQSIDRCDFVLADPSRHNPFVMYELGVARRRRRPTLVILDRADSQLSGSLDGSAYRPYANDALDTFSARLEADLTQLATPAAARNHSGDLAAHHARAGELLAQLQQTSELPLEAVSRGAFATRLRHAVAHGSFADDFADTPLGAAGLLAAITRSSRMLDTMDAIRTWVDGRR